MKNSATKLEVLYEDNHVIVVNKPVGVSVQADRTSRLCLMDIVKQYLKQKYSKPGEVFLGLVHRLDQPVSGVMVFARTSKAASRLSEQFRQHTIVKKYTAIVSGKLTNKQGTLINYLKKDLNKNIVQVINTPEEGFLRAELEYKVIKVKPSGTLVEINLKTGRPHQIRAQFSHLGHPLIGDVKYGYHGPKTDLALQATELTFMHPTKKEPITIKTKPVLKF